MVARLKPIPQQFELEPMAVWMSGEITIMFENTQYLPDSFGSVGKSVMKLVLDDSPSASGKHALCGGLRENLHCYGKGLLTKRGAKAGLVVNEIALPPWPEKSIAISLRDILLDHGRIRSHFREVFQLSEEPMYEVRHSEAKHIMNGTCDVLVRSQFVFLGEPLEAGNAGVAIPRIKPKGSEVVDAIRQSEALNQRKKPRGC